MASITISHERDRIVVRGARSQNTQPYFDPLGQAELDDLRWYFEEFSDFPAGGDQERARRVGKQIAEWGMRTFNRLLDHQSFAEELDMDLDLSFESAQASFLSAPWELLYCKSCGGFLAPNIRALCRRISATNEDRSAAGKTRRALQGPVSILIVISRPRELESIPTHNVVEPILAIIDRMAGQVQIDVLRPPTLANLSTTLRSKQYDVVHFDGHGGLIGEPEHEGGYLFFETETARRDPVHAHRMRQTLEGCDLPLFVLNACNSASFSGSDPFSSVAAELVRAGSPAVVAMSYAVRAKFVSEFMGSFYASLLGGATITASVTAARKAVYREAGATIAEGVSSGAHDWAIPALYVAGTGPGSPLRPKIASSVTHARSSDTSRISFEKDDDLLKLERALRDSSRPVVFARGRWGEGKTAFIKSFADWYLRTGGCEHIEYVDFHADFRVSRAFPFLPPSPATAGSEVLNSAIQYLKQRQWLVIWDHVGLIDRASRRLLKEGLGQLPDGAVGRLVIVTTEPATGSIDRTQDITISDMTDAQISRLLVPHLRGGAIEGSLRGAGLRRLLLAMGYHYATVEAVSGLLSTIDPEVLIDALTWGRPSDLTGLNIDRVLGLIGLLPDSDRRHLAFVSLFGASIIAMSISLHTNGGTTRDLYYKVVGAHVTTRRWSAILGRAARIGLLGNQRGVGRVAQSASRAGFDIGRVFTLPPLVRLALRGAIEKQLGRDTTRELERELFVCYASAAEIWTEHAESPGHEMATVLRLEESTILRGLQYSIRNAEWTAARSFYEALDLRFNLDDLIRIRMELSRDATYWYDNRYRDDGEEKGFALFLLEKKAQLLKDEGKLEEAIEANQQILKVAADGSDSRLEASRTAAHYRIAAIALDARKFDLCEAHLNVWLQYQEKTGSVDLPAAYHLRGMLEQGRYNLEAADDWFQKARSAVEGRGDVLAACVEYHHLGIVAKLRGNLEEAENWLLKALRSRELLGAQLLAATDKSVLGEISEQRGNLDAAEVWFRSALQDCYRLGDNIGAAHQGQHLAMVLEQKDRLDEAAGWIRWSLPFFEVARDKLGIAHGRHQLGIIAMKANELGTAEAHFEAGLAIYREISSKEYEAGALMMLGNVSLLGGILDAARTRFRMALCLCEQLQRPELLMNTLGSLSQVEMRAKQYNAAAAYLERAVAIASQCRSRLRERLADDLATVRMRMKSGL
jgi:tetratricopeptide (TPR) repeat protein